MLLLSYKAKKRKTVCNSWFCTIMRYMFDVLLQDNKSNKITIQHLVKN